MRLKLRIPLLIVSLFIVASAYGKPGKNGRRKGKSEPESTRPAIVVAVVNLKVDSDKDKVKDKIEELTNKLRDEVDAQAKNYQVISSRKMRVLRRKHRKAIANCYDDCDVEFGLLANANFVIGGHLEPSTSGIIGTLEIRNTQNRSVVATKKVSGANYFEFESALIASVRRFVRPLNHVVFQATDDEVVKDEQAQKPAEEDVTGLGSSSDAATVGPEDQGGSDFVARQEEERGDDSSILDPYWEKTKDEAPFLKEEDLGFADENGPGIFAVGIKGGYSFNVSSAKHMRKLYTPVFHLGASIMARVHHLFEIALVADIDYLSGKSHSDDRFGTSRLYDANPYDNQQAGQLTDITQTNEYGFGNYFTVGVRPTFRLIIPFKLLEFNLGAGVGANYAKTSGYWWARAEAIQHNVRDSGDPPRPAQKNDIYNFEKKSVGFYAAFEAAVMVRAFSDRLGVGAFFQLKVASMWKSGAKTDVTSIETIPPDPLPPNPETYYFGEPISAFGVAQADDVKNSPIGHLDSLYLMTIGLTADWRF